MSKLHWTLIWGTVLLSQCNSNPRWAPMFRRTQQCAQYPWSGRTKSLSNGAEATKTYKNKNQPRKPVAQNTWTLWLSGKLVLLRYVTSTIYRSKNQAPTSRSAPSVPTSHQWPRPRIPGKQKNCQLFPKIVVVVPPNHPWKTIHFGVAPFEETPIPNIKPRKTFPLPCLDGQNP